MTIRFCRHCNQEYGVRAGRGLCRPCWDNPAIRAQYPLMAAFGGKDASAFWQAKAAAKRARKAALAQVKKEGRR
jgi:hypothetical protein